MRRDGIPVAKSAVILVLNMLLYTGALVLVGAIGFGLCPDIYYGMDTLAQILILIGFGATMLLARMDPSPDETKDPTLQ